MHMTTLENIKAISVSIAAFLTVIGKEPLNVFAVIAYVMEPLSLTLLSWVYHGRSVEL